MSFSPLDLVSAHPWSRVTFTTYALSLSFFEAVILDALIRGGGRQALILSDVEGVRGSLSEQGAQRVGKEYEVEPVAVCSGVFHPKVSVFSGGDECHLLVGSGNLTFNGWGGNCEVFEHLHPSFAADAFVDAVDFFERLSNTPRIRHGARDHCAATASDLRRVAQGKTINGNIRLIHNLEHSIAEQIVGYAEELGGATRVVAAAPFWDHGAAIDRLCAALKIDHVFIHNHLGGAVLGTAGSNWPSAFHKLVRPVRLDVLDDTRHLHAKLFEIMCKRGRLLISGSANGTAAALEGGHNVEACIVRIQRERTIGWNFLSCEAPTLPASLDTEKEENPKRSGILRAVLDGDNIVGEVLTPIMSGEVSVFHLSSEGLVRLADTTILNDGHFQINAPRLEEKSWLVGRLVIRVEDKEGRQAEGFVSVASFAEITRRSGAIGRRLLALLAGTETPDDVAAIMSWIYEDPTRLNNPSLTDMHGGNEGGAIKDPDFIINVAALRVAALKPELVTGSNKSGPSHWVRFIDHILVALRQQRGSFAQVRAGSEEDDEEHVGEREVHGVPDPDISKSFAVFEKLFDTLLRPGSSSRQIFIAFDLAEYMCERLRPSVAQARAWLERLVKAVSEAGVPPERRNDIATSILMLTDAESKITSLRWAKEQILSLGFDLMGDPPLSESLHGFQAVLHHVVSFNDLWEKIQNTRTYAEQVREYLEALKSGSGSPEQFEELANIAPEEWQSLKAALTSKEPFKKITLADKWYDICPKCYIGLPTGEEQKLRTIGIATAKNCGHGVIVWKGQ